MLIRQHHPVDPQILRPRPCGHVLAPVERSHFHDQNTVPVLVAHLLDAAYADDIPARDIDIGALRHVLPSVHDGHAGDQDIALPRLQLVTLDVLVVSCNRPRGSQQQEGKQVSHGQLFDKLPEADFQHDLIRGCPVLPTGVRIHVRGDLVYRGVPARQHQCGHVRTPDSEFRLLLGHVRYTDSGGNLHAGIKRPLYQFGLQIGGMRWSGRQHEQGRKEKCFHGICLGTLPGPELAPGRAQQHGERDEVPPIRRASGATRRPWIDYCIQRVTRQRGLLLLRILSVAPERAMCQP